MNLGLRYEVQNGPYTNKYDTPALRALAAAGFNSKRKTDMNNVGPRVGFAWDVKGDAKAVVRGGYGRYYDEIFQNITLYEAWSDARTPLNFVTLSPAPWTPNFYAANSAAIRQSLLDPNFTGQLTRLTAPNLKQPSSDQYNLGFSAQPSPQFAFDLDYVHAVGHDEIMRWRINTPQNLSTEVSPAGVFAPQFGPFNVEGNHGHSKFDGIYVTGKVRNRKVSLIATYAWTKTRNIDNDFNNVPSDITNLNFEQDWGPSPNDIRHRGTLGAVVQLPAAFQVSTSVQANTGKPFSASAGLTGLRASVRAVDPSTGQMFPRNSFRTDGVFSWDIRLSKMFNFGKERQIEALFEVLQRHEPRQLRPGQLRVPLLVAATSATRPTCSRTRSVRPSSASASASSRKGGAGPAPRRNPVCREGRRVAPPRHRWGRGQRSRRPAPAGPGRDRPR